MPDGYVIVFQSPGVPSYSDFISITSKPSKGDAGLVSITFSLKFKLASVTVAVIDDVSKFK